MKKVVYIWFVSVYNSLVRKPIHHIMTETAKIARKNLIAEIARRHAAERDFVKSVAVKESTATSDEHEAIVAEEFARLEKASVILG